MKKKKRKKKAKTLEVKSNVRGIFGSSFHELSPLSFLPILGKELFGEPREKIPEPYHLFSFISTQPNILKKSFSSHFCLQSFPSTLFHL